MKNLRFSVNVLALLAGILMIVAMTQPWWSFSMSEGRQTDIFPYLVDGPASEFIGYQRSPQMTLLTGVLIAAILITLGGGVLSGRLSRVFLFLGGVLVLLGAWRLLIRVSGVAAGFGIPLQGHGRAVYQGFGDVEVWAKLQPGIYLIIAGGIVALAAGLLHKHVRAGN